MTHLRISERSMTTWDGVELFYRVWRPPDPGDKALLLFHRGHEHSGRFQELVETLALQESGLEDLSVFAWDARGHGRSPGERGYAESFGCLVKDVEAFVRVISKEYAIPIENMAVLGYSAGGVLVSAWVRDYAPPIRALILGVPAFRVKLYVPFALPLFRLRQTLGHKGFVKSYVRSRMLTHDPEQARLYDGDPLVSRAIAVNILIGLFDASTRLLADAGAIRVPALLLAAGSDWVVKVSAQKRFFDRLGSPVKAMEVFPEFYHGIFHEQYRRRPIAKAREFILEAFRRPSVQPQLLDEHRTGYTKAEYDRLAAPLPLLSPRRLWYAAMRLPLRTFGRLSEGIRIGWSTGFDSGESLDYVYENTPRGTTPVGRLIDRMYLNSVGWKGIRQRKVNLQKVLESLISKIGAERAPVRLLDIASGPGRYMLDTLRKMPDAEVSAVLRDYEPRALEAGRALARQMNLSNVTYARGDAFDPDSLAAVSPRPHIAIVSGLYELFPDNDKVSRSLRGLQAALEEGGYLIYTNQPWHPQLEMIARVLVNRDGAPWVMRRRAQAEMDALVRAAGFEKLEMEIDEYGIFSVSTARKKAAS
jgi:alpha-beta hydrolase superfamily lysophospholipase/SAM-dependent methyltransferase